MQAPGPEKRVSNRLETRSGSSQTRLPAPPPAAAEGRRRGRCWTACLGYFPSEFRAGLRHAFLVPVLVLSGVFIRTFTLFKCFWRGHSRSAGARDRVLRFRATRGGLFARRKDLPPGGRSYNAAPVSEYYSRVSWRGPGVGGPL